MQIREAISPIDIMSFDDDADDNSAENTDTTDIYIPVRHRRRGTKLRGPWQRRAHEASGGVGDRVEVGLEVVGPDQSLLHERGVRVAAGPPVSGRTQANKTEAIACTVYPRGVTNALRAAGATGPRSFKTHTHLCPGLAMARIQVGTLRGPRRTL